MISNALFFVSVIVYPHMLPSYFKPYLTKTVFLSNQNPCGNMFICFEQVCDQRIFQILHIRSLKDF